MLSSFRAPFIFDYTTAMLQACTFLARSDHRRPSVRLAYSIADYIKPKARENVTADLKLGFLSISILDSSCGMVTNFAKAYSFILS